MAVLDRTHERSQHVATASLRMGPVLLVAGAVILIIALLQVVQTSDAATTNIAIQWLEQEKLELQTLGHQLEAEVASLSSLSRVEREARERLGLVPSETRESVEVNVAWPAADQPRLPSRFAPEREAEVDERSSPWWRDLLGLLAFD